MGAIKYLRRYPSLITIYGLLAKRGSIMESEKKIFSPAQVSLHNNINDCWVIINARVYEVTNFLNDHPGGPEILLAEAGKDASEDFEAAGHGSGARLMLDEFYVGEIIQHSDSTIPKMINTRTPHRAKVEEEAKNNSSLLFLLPLALVGFVVSLGFFKK